MKPKTTFETARDEACANYFNAEKSVGVFRMAAYGDGANWAREFTRTEILKSPELKALIETIELSLKRRNDAIAKNPNASPLMCGMTTGIAYIIERALSNFQAKFGSPTETKNEKR